MPAKAWWREGVRFECQGGGGCCVSHGECGSVYLTREDAGKLAKHLGISVAELAGRYCREGQSPLNLKDAEGSEACIFLVDRRCSVYQARPTQCRTWPFWPEVMGPRKWREQVAGFCPGVGKGRLVPAEAIEAALDEQRRADAQLALEGEQAEGEG